MSKWTGWALLLWFLLFPQAVKNGILNGLKLGEQVLIPSIFPYLVISGILVKTGGLQKISKNIRLGNLSSSARGLLIPSFFCGYPTGARLSAMAYDHGSITKEEFTLLFLFANIPGFGFTVSYLGGMYQNPASGFLMYVSFFLSSLTLLWWYGKQLPGKATKEIFTPPKANASFSDALVESVSEGALTMVSLLFFVCFFSSLIDLISYLPLPKNCFPIGASFLEITTGLSFLSRCYPIEAVVFFSAFSGLSVLFQSLYFDKNHAVNFLRLLLGRTVYGIISVCYFLLLRSLI